MKKTHLIFIFCAYLLPGGECIAQETNGIEREIKKIEELTGVKGVVNNEEHVFKLTIPRSDLSVMVNETKVPASAGISSWIAFKKENGKTIVMGDLALLQDQVNPVITTALHNGLEVTALHNHFMWENPRMMFLHIKGMDSTHKLAYAIGKVLATMRETAGKKNDVAFPVIDSDPLKVSLDPSELDEILGLEGTFENDVYKIVIGRNATIEDFKVGKTMGINTWAAIIGSSELAMIDGDCAVTKKELQKVLVALNKNDFYITAVHQHMVNEEPGYLFVHFYGVGKAEKLAKDFRAALDIIQAPKDTMPNSPAIPSVPRQTGRP